MGVVEERPLASVQRVVDEFSGVSQLFSLNSTEVTLQPVVETVQAAVRSVKEAPVVSNRKVASERAVDGEKLSNVCQTNTAEVDSSEPFRPLDSMVPKRRSYSSYLPNLFPGLSPPILSVPTLPPLSAFVPSPKAYFASFYSNLPSWSDEAAIGECMSPDGDNREDSKGSSPATTAATERDLSDLSPSQSFSRWSFRLGSSDEKENLATRQKGMQFSSLGEGSDTDDDLCFARAEVLCQQKSAIETGKRPLPLQVKWPVRPFSFKQALEAGLRGWSRSRRETERGSFACASVENPSLEQARSLVMEYEKQHSDTFGSHLEEHSARWGEDEAALAFGLPLEPFTFGFTLEDMRFRLSTEELLRSLPVSNTLKMCTQSYTRLLKSGRVFASCNAMEWLFDKNDLAKPFSVERRGSDLDGERGNARSSFGGFMFSTQRMTSDLGELFVPRAVQDMFDYLRSCAVNATRVLANLNSSLPKLPNFSAFSSLPNRPRMPGLSAQPVLPALASLKPTTHTDSDSQT